MAEELYCIIMKEQLEKILNEKRDEVDKLPSKWLSPSGLGCAWSCRFKLEGIQPEKETRTIKSQGIPDIGSAIHEHIQKWLVNKGGVFKDVWDYVKTRELALDLFKYKKKFKTLFEGKEIEVDIELDKLETTLQDEKLLLRFKCDGVVELDGKLAIMEIKSESMRKWLNRTSPEPDHQKQAICYSLELQLDTILWLYVNRDTFEVKVYEQHITDQERAQMRLYITDIITKELKDLPQSDNCRYCKYKQHCAEESKKVKQLTIKENPF